MDGVTLWIALWLIVVQLQQMSLFFRNKTYFVATTDANREADIHWVNNCIIIFINNICKKNNINRVIIIS